MSLFFAVLRAAQFPPAPRPTRAALLSLLRRRIQSTTAEMSFTASSELTAGGALRTCRIQGRRFCRVAETAHIHHVDDVTHAGDVLGQGVVRDRGIEVRKAPRAASVEEEHGDPQLFMHGGLDFADKNPYAGFAVNPRVSTGEAEHHRPPQAPESSSLPGSSRSAAASFVSEPRVSCVNPLIGPSRLSY